MAQPFLGAYEDPLQKMFRHGKIGRREMIWLWFTLQDEAIGFSPIPQNPDTAIMRQEMARTITENRLFIRLERRRATAFLPHDEISWIKKNDHQSKWLLKKLIDRNEVAHLQLPVCPPGEILIGLLDAFLPFESNPSHRKRQRLLSWQTDCARHQSQKVYFDWYIKGGREKQKCEIAWQWYRENHPNELGLLFKFSKLADVQGFLDDSGFMIDEKRYHLEQIKKKFKSMRVQDSRRARTQTNLSLSYDSRTKLDQLAERERMSKTEVIELLIQGAHEKGMLK